MNTLSATGRKTVDQPAWLRHIAKFISVIFHPLFIPAYIAAYLIYGQPYTFAVLDEKQKLLRLISIFIITAFFPAATVFLLWRLKFADSILLRTQKERIIPYVASTIFFFWAFYVNKNIPGSSTLMTSFMLGIFLCISAGLMANNYFKISMHAMGVSGGVTFLILMALHTTGTSMGMELAIASIIGGLVCTSRLIVSDHSQHEVYWGIILGALCQLVASWFFM